MIKLRSFRSKLFITLLPVFVVFTLIVMLFQYNREVDYKKNQLNQSLLQEAELTHQFIQKNNLIARNQLKLVDSLVQIIPTHDLRITIVDASGRVIYDNRVNNLDSLQNHLDRPEIVESIGSGVGSDIRESKSTGKPYYYLSKRYPDYFVRTAVLYNLEVKHFLKAGYIFIIFTLTLFVVVWFLLLFVTKRFSITINQLKDYALQLKNGDEIRDDLLFTDDEFGVIGRQIVNSYKELKEAKDSIQVEKEKLFKHLLALNEGIAFFNSEKKKILTNNKFIQYINVIADVSTVSAEQVFAVKELQELITFVDVHLSDWKVYDEKNPLQKEITIQKANQFFNVQCVIFQDKSIEFIITDTTKLEKRKLLKQELTSNIAHELRTPVTAVKGYVETLLNQQVEPEKQTFFLERAASQINRLDALIDDITVLNKLEEFKEHYTFEPIHVKDVFNEARESLLYLLAGKNVKIDVKIADTVRVNANRSLMFSVFHNLLENALKYAGDEAEITVTNYLEDEKFYYFSFSDNGTGIPEEHLNRIFERFYRIDSGRSRKTGGTGLGLSIVKNAIQLHKGEISARNKVGGGLEFLFNLPKLK